MSSVRETVYERRSAADTLNHCRDSSHFRSIRWKMKPLPCTGIKLSSSISCASLGESSRMITSNIDTPCEFGLSSMSSVSADALSSNLVRVRVRVSGIGFRLACTAYSPPRLTYLQERCFGGVPRSRSPAGAVLSVVRVEYDGSGSN